MAALQHASYCKFLHLRIVSDNPQLQIVLRIVHYPDCSFRIVWDNPQNNLENSPNLAIEVLYVLR
jgi:hypothetical protein